MTGAPEIRDPALVPVPLPLNPPEQPQMPRDMEPSAQRFWRALEAREVHGNEARYLSDLADAAGVRIQAVHEEIKA